MDGYVNQINGNDPELVFVHMSKDEVGEFSRAQGMEDINQELGGIPQFIKLGEMLSDPQIKEALRLVIKGYSEATHEEKSHLNSDMDSYLDQKVGDERSFTTPNMNEAPEVQEMESLGVGGDNQLVVMPKNLLYFIWDNIPEEMRESNPKTGFPQFALLTGIGNAISMIANITGGLLTGYGIYSDYKKQNQYQQEMKDAYAQDVLNHEANQRRHRKLLGLDSPLWNTPGSYERANNPREVNYRLPYKKGGRVDDVRSMPPMNSCMLIEGHEPGQKDNIYIDVPKGSRILDARTVSDIGDGNTEAGAKIILDYIDKCPIDYHKKYDYVQCALSAGEVGIVPEAVEYIGRGSIDKGHKKLDAFVKKLRADKKHSIHDIPKKTKSIEYYLGKNLARA
jgi:hypothetical protein